MDTNHKGKWTHCLMPCLTHLNTKLSQEWGGSCSSTAPTLKTEVQLDARPCHWIPVAQLVEGAICLTAPRIHKGHGRVVCCVTGLGRKCHPQRTVDRVLIQGRAAVSCLNHPGSQPLPTRSVPPWGLRHQFMRICVHAQTEALSQLAQDTGAEDSLLHEALLRGHS